MGVSIKINTCLGPTAKPGPNGATGMPHPVSERHTAGFVAAPDGVLTM